MVPRSLALLAAALGLTALVADARADWPMARHDPRRTGFTTGTSDLQTPLPYWRQFLGGSLGVAAVTPVSADTVAYVGAGRLRVLGTTGVPRWSSDNLALTVLLARADLDGDGALELVARSTDRVYVFDAATGLVRWAEPPGEMGTIADVRVDDVDGLAGVELIIQECYCCQIRSNTPGVAYSFRDGWSSPRRVWTLPSSACGGARQMLAADVTGDGAPEYVLSTHRDLRLLDGTTAVAFASSPDLGEWASLAICEAHDVLPGAGDELVCVRGTQLAPGIGHQAFVLQHRTGPDRLALVWSVDVGARDADFILGAGHVVDLDGDGVRELTVSGLNAAGQPVTFVIDTATGATLASIEGQEVVGAIVPTASETVFITQASQQLLGWTFDRSAIAPLPRLQLRWRIKDRRVLLERNWDLAATTVHPDRIVTADVNGDGALDLFTVDTKRPDELPVYDARNPADTTLRTWKARAGAEIIAGWRDGDRVVISSSDGRLTTVTSDLTTSLGSFRAGQYYDAGGWLHLPFAPIAAQLTGDPAAEVVVADSRRALIALDARTATNAAPPRQLWELRSTSAPAIVPGLGTGGGPGLACRRIDTGTVPATERVARLDANGAVRWEISLAGPIFNDVLHGNLDGDAVPDLVVQWGLTSDNVVRTTALAGTDGHTLWSAATSGGEARFPSGAAVADWNGDGVDDVVFHHWGTYVLSGVNGAALATGGPGLSSYFMPTVQDLDGDGRPEVTLGGGQSPMRTLRHDLQSALWVSDDDLPYPYGANALCPSRVVSASTSLAHPARLKLIPQTGPGAGVASTVVLAGGQLFPDEAAATAAGKPLGQLTSVHVHGNLTGEGHASAVVGSSDGWLYAVDPCAGTLDFAVPFGAPVGAAAFADVDADGLDDLLVSVADGYLYGLRNAPLAGPGLVRDLEPGGASAEDIDEVIATDTLSAAWDAVPGAASYEVAIALADGGYIAEPAWQAVDATAMTRSGLPLVDGERYVIAVRAVTASGGRSPDVLSDGVLVHFAPPDVDAGVDPGEDAGIEPPPPSPSGGCCSTGTRGETAIGGALLVAFMLLRRRRR